MKRFEKELDEGMGLMQYFNYGSRENYKELLEKVKSAYPRIETVRNKAYGVMVCDIQKPLNEKEIEILKDYLPGSIVTAGVRALLREELKHCAVYCI